MLSLPPAPSRWAGELERIVADEVVNRVVAVGECRPHPRNYNGHDEGQIGDLRASLRRFGQVRSVVVQALSPGLSPNGGGGYLVVAGNGVHEAARLEGLESLRADVIPADWDEARVLAYLAADNELARRARPDEAQLAVLVALERLAGMGLEPRLAG